MNRILVADDEAVTRAFLAKVLAGWGYEVQVVQNGINAFEALLADDAPPLALLDWVMPGMIGPEICRAVRSRSDRYVYTVLLTSRTETSDLVAGLDAGADDYLVKPFDVAELQARLRVGNRIVKLESELRVRATYDALTGLLGRGAILDLLSREVDRARRSSRPLAAMMIDIDHFKQINDTHGHLVGDQVIRKTADALSKATRGYDGVGRYGGEEFLVIVPECDEISGRNIAERIRSIIGAAPLDLQGLSLPVRVSIGLAVGTIRDQTSDTLLRASDDALYRAKKAGRDRVEFYAWSGSSNGESLEP